MKGKIAAGRMREAGYVEEARALESLLLQAKLTGQAPEPPSPKLARLAIQAMRKAGPFASGDLTRTRHRNR
jgi:hypothetical protein